MNEAASILVADDDPGIRATVVDILSTVGHHVTEAEDGEVALELLAKQPVEVLVLDVRMPKRDGISVVENIVPDPPPPVIVLVSAYKIDRQLRAELSQRVFRHLQKPVPPAKLIETVSAAAELAKALRS